MQIGDIIMNLPCSIRKYHEIIFLIAVRLIKEKSYNYQMLEKYFKLYEMTKDKGLFLNEQLIVLLDEIKELKGNSKERYEESIIPRNKTIEKASCKDLFSIDCKKKPKNIIPILQMNITKPLESKLTFKSKKYNNNKKIEYKEIISPIMIYNITNEMLEDYLLDLDGEKITKKQLFENVIINLMYFTQILPDKFPNDINKFLFSCLDENKMKF